MKRSFSIRGPLPPGSRAPLAGTPTPRAASLGAATLFRLVFAAALLGYTLWRSDPGEVWQVANIQKCREERGETVLIARFPLQPFKWDDVCPGFQAVILGEPRLDLSV